jgi:hypothetical protein
MTMRPTITIRFTFEGLTQAQADAFAERLVARGDIQGALCDEAASLELPGISVAAEVVAVASFVLTIPTDEIPGAVFAATAPEPCSCDEALALRAEVLDLRAQVDVAMDAILALLDFSSGAVSERYWETRRGAREMAIRWAEGKARKKTTPVAAVPSNTGR